MASRWLLSASLVLLMLAGCGDGSSTPAISPCPEGNLVGDTCAGVPADALCDDAVCSTGDCGEVLVVTPDGYEAPIAGASPGTCVALTPGTYGAIVLPVGVSLFGQGADHVTVGSVDVTGGAGVRVRGLTIRAGSLRLAGQGVSVDAVRVDQSPLDGIEVAAGATVAIERTEVRGSQRHGISAFDASSVDIASTIVSGPESTGQSIFGGPGAWLQCGAGCDCTGTISVSVTNVAFRGNSIVGLALVGVDALLSNVEVSGTTVGASFEAGGGVSISGCSLVTASELRITDSADFGLLVDHSTVQADRLEASGNLRGVWIQHISAAESQSVGLLEVAVSDNDGTGIGVDGLSAAVTINTAVISNTRVVALPVLVDGTTASMESVGDGITWLGGSYLSLDAVSISGSERQSVLIDGEVAANSFIDHVTLAEGDELTGVLQQSLPPGGQQPTVGASAPAITTLETERHPVPNEIAIPPGI